jgi:FkbM family methyltransferase
MTEAPIGEGDLDRILSTLSDERNDATVRNAVAPLYFDDRRAATIVICGFGALGRVVKRIAQSANLEIAAITDNNPAKWTRSCDDGIPVMSPADAAELYGGDLPFVTAIYNSSGPRVQLELLGAKRIVSYPAFCWAYPEFAPRFMGFETPAWIFARRDRLRLAFDVLSDAESRSEFAAQVGWRCTLDYSLLGRPRSGADMYFDEGVYRVNEIETLMDCGAYDGDTLRAFLARSRGKFGRIYALEPDPQNRVKLQAWTTSLPPSDRERITVLPYAVGERDEQVSFGEGQGVVSRVGDSGSGLRVDCRRIDSIAATLPTIVKMDIEGAELGALRGAAATIAAARPILTLSSYHFTEHLWEIPLLIRELAPDYRISLRRYAAECWEMAYYGVPPERAGTRG